MSEVEKEINGELFLNHFSFHRNVILVRTDLIKWPPFLRNDIFT